MVKLKTTEVQNLIDSNSGFKGYLLKSEYHVKPLAEVVEIKTAKGSQFIHASSWMLHSIDAKGNKVYDPSYLDHIEKGLDLPNNGVMYCNVTKTTLNYKRWFFSKLSGMQFPKDTFYFISKTFEMFAIPKADMEKLAGVAFEYASATKEEEVIEETVVEAPPKMTHEEGWALIAKMAENDGKLPDTPEEVEAKKEEARIKLEQEENLILNLELEVQLKISDALTKGSQVFLIEDTWIPMDPSEVHERFKYVFSKTEAMKVTGLATKSFNDHLKYHDKHNRYRIKMVGGTLRNSRGRIKLFMRKPLDDLYPENVSSTVTELARKSGIPYHRLLEDISNNRQAWISNIDTHVVYQVRAGDVEWKDDSEVDTTLYSDDWTVRNKYTKPTTVDVIPAAIPDEHLSAKAKLELGRKKDPVPRSNSLKDLAKLVPMAPKKAMQSSEVTYRSLQDLEIVLVKSRMDLCVLLGNDTYDAVINLIDAGHQALVITPWGERVQFRCGKGMWNGISECRYVLHETRLNK